MATQSIGGKMKVSYVSKKTGRPVEGTNIYLAEPITSNFGEGCICDKVYVSSSVMAYDDIKLGKCEVSFDRYGNVKSIRY